MEKHIVVRPESVFRLGVLNLIALWHYKVEESTTIARGKRSDPEKWVIVVACNKPASERIGSLLARRST